MENRKLVVFVSGEAEVTEAIFKKLKDSSIDVTIVCHGDMNALLRRDVNKIRSFENIENLRKYLEKNEFDLFLFYNYPKEIVAKLYPLVVGKAIIGEKVFEKNLAGYKVGFVQKDGSVGETISKFYFDTNNPEEENDFQLEMTKNIFLELVKTLLLDWEFGYSEISQPVLREYWKNVSWL